MKVLDLVRYDPEKGCFVLKDNRPTPPLSPFRWREAPRPSIFMEDARFRARTSTGVIESEEGLGYKQFGIYTRAKERQLGMRFMGSTKAPITMKHGVR